MRRHLSPCVAAGLFSGVAFLLHALLPNSHAYPLLWPFLGGALAFYLMRRSEDAGAPGLLGSAGVGLRAGLVAAAVFLAVGAPTVFLLTQPYMEPVARRLGATGPAVVTYAALFGLAVGAVAGVLLAVLGSLVARPVVLRHRSA